MTSVGLSEEVFRFPKRNPIYEERVLSPIQIATFFELSTEDKKQEPPRCSLWATSLTTIQQAYEFQQDRFAQRWVVGFPVALIAEADWIIAGFQRPEIVWDEEVERRSGWEGHAGFLNLQQGGSGTRRKIRTWIADFLNTCQPFSSYPDTP